MSCCKLINETANENKDIIRIKQYESHVNRRINPGWAKDLLMRQWGKEERRKESEMNERDADWDDLMRRIRKAVQEWRDENPTATLTEIENAVDDELSVARIELIEELALQARSRDLREIPLAERPKCPECGRPVVANGKQSRTLTTNHDKHIELERSKAYCKHCEVSFFPSG